MSASSTPDRLRLMSIVTVVVIISIGLAAWLLTDRLVSQTEQVATSTGEVLIATQQVSASFAEADAAAVSVHLAGADGNREQRRLYEQAAERATASLEQVARLVGDDERSHEALQDIAARTVEYAGLIEAARLSSVEGLPAADQLLTQASAINRNEITPDVQIVADRARSNFNDEVSSGWYLTAIILLLMAAAVVIAMHILLSRRFRRLVNVPLAIAAVLLIGLVFVSGRAFLTQQAAFDDAQQEAFDAIQVSEQIQTNAYRHRALGTASVLTGVANDSLVDFEVALSDPTSGLLNQAGIEAGSLREVIVADEIRIRWDRYILQSDRIQRAIDSGGLAEAADITQGPANAAFNGFNASVEAALLDNREQFLDQLNTASDSLRWLREYILIGTLLAALLAWWGFAQRIGEYR